MFWAPGRKDAAAPSLRSAPLIPSPPHPWATALLSLSLLGLPALAAEPSRPPAKAPDRAVETSRAEVGRLEAALLGETPLGRDLHSLVDEVGGRATGSAANLRAVDWALARFREAGVEVRKEAFEMPALWLERSAAAEVRGEGVDFSPRVASMPFSTGTPPAGQTAPLLDVGRGQEKDFQALGERARGAFVLVEQVELKDVDGLFREYTDSAEIEQRAAAAGGRPRPSRWRPGPPSSCGSIRRDWWRRRR